MLDVARAIERHADGDQVSRAIVTGMGDRPEPPATDFASLALAGYSQNPVVHACIAELSKAFASIPIVAERRTPKKEWVPADERHPLGRISLRPNEVQKDPAGFHEQAATDFQIGGNGFFEIERSRSGVPLQLWQLRQDKIDIIADKSTGRISHYDFTVSRSKEPRHLLPGDVIHWRKPNPLSSYWGLSSLAVAAIVGDLDNTAFEYLRSFFANAGVPVGLLTTDKIVTKKDSEAISKRWTERVGRAMVGGVRGLANWFKLAVLDGGWKYEQIGSPLDKLKLDHVFSQTETRICACLGVHPLLVAVHIGLLRSTYSNLKLVETDFWKRTAKPLVERYASALTCGLAHEFGRDYRFRADLRGVEALQKSEAEIRQQAREDFNAGLITRDQALEATGREPVDNEPLFKLPRGVVMIGPGATPDAFATPAAFQAFERRMLEGLKAGQLKAVDAPAITIDSPAERHATIPEVDRIIDAARLERDSAIVEATADLFVEISTTNAEAVIAELALDVTYDPTVPALTEWLKTKAITFADKAYDTTIDKLRPSLVEGLDAGETIQELADRVDAVFEGRKNNALTVARTETAGTANAGSAEAYRQAGLEENEWLKGGPDSRESHQALDGVRVAIGARFDNGCRFPGDSDAGDPAEFINCTCTLVGVVPGDEDDDESNAVTREATYESFAQRLNTAERQVADVFGEMIELQLAAILAGLDDIEEQAA